MTPDTALSSERSSSSIHSRLPSLTGLRFIAAFLVFLFHTSLANSPIPPYAPTYLYNDHTLASVLSEVFSRGGYVGVSFFFVLSGFVLTWSHKPTDTKEAFWRRRIVKIFPNHIVTWALAMILFAGAFTSWTAWLPNLFLVHSFFPQPNIYVSVNPPNWSLCSELLFYLSFPLLIGLIRRIRANRLWYWAAAAVVAMLAIALIDQYLIPASPKSPITPVSGLQFWFGYAFPPSRIFEFILGALLARIIVSGKWPRIKVWHSVVLFLAGYGIALVIPFIFSFDVATVIPIGLLIGSVAILDVQNRPSMLRTRVMQWLGEVSFGFYLCQGIVVFYGRMLIGNYKYFSTLASIGILLGFLATTILAGWLLYTCVERPMMRRWSRSRKQTHASQDPVQSVIHDGPATSYDDGNDHAVVPADFPSAEAPAQPEIPQPAADGTAGNPRDP